MKQEFYDALEANPVIAAVKDMNGLKECCNQEDIKVVFILFGDICTIVDIVQYVKEADKIAMVHLDLINGLGSKEVAVDFVKKHTMADGIITTKPALIKRARELTMCTVLRCFMLDSMAFENIKQPQYNVKPDCIEILPGVMPKVIKKLCKMVKTPIIAGGLIADKEDVMGALTAGAICVSTTNQSVWKM